MKNILEQEISNHPKFPNIKRKVVVTELNIQPKFGQIYIEAYKQFFDEEDVDVSKEFNTEIKNWFITDKDTTTVRNADGSPVFHPDYNPELPESEDNIKYLKQPSFQYFFNLLTNKNSPSPIKLLRSHIYFNDQVKFFD